METASTVAVTPPSSLSTSSSHPTPSYRIAMTSGTGTAETGAAPAPPKATRSPSVVNSLPEGLLGPPVQRPARLLSLPPRLHEQTAQQLRSNLPPPPPSPALRRRASVLFYAIVAQFFLSIGCLFWVIATTITLLSFGLDCSFGLGTSGIGVLALLVFAFMAVSAQLITSAIGVAAFSGKQQVETKTHLLTSYLALDLVLLFVDAGLLFVCAVGGVLSFINELDCAGQVKVLEYTALASFFLFFGFTLLLHLIVSAGVSLLLCWTSELFIQRGSSTPVPATTTPTIAEEYLSPTAPPIKRFSQV